MTIGDHLEKEGNVAREGLGNRGIKGEAGEKGGKISFWFWAAVGSKGRSPALQITGIILFSC